MNNEEQTKILTAELYRILGADLMAKLLPYIGSIINIIKQQYAGAVYLTQAQYDALPESEKLDSSKTYWIEEESV